MLRKREIQAAVVLGDAGGEGGILSWSSTSKGGEGWFKRMESGRSALLLSDRNVILGQHPISRHDRVLIPGANDGLLLWESLRRAPEGFTAALVDTETARDALFRYAASLDVVERPEIALFPGGKLPGLEEAETLFSAHIFDRIFARELWRREAGFSVFHRFAENAWKLLAPRGIAVILQSPPVLGERISRILEDECAAPGDMTIPLKSAEEAFFTVSDAASERWTWDGETLEKAFLSARWPQAP